MVILNYLGDILSLTHLLLIY